MLQPYIRSRLGHGSDCLIWVNFSTFVVTLQPSVMLYVRLAYARGYNMLKYIHRPKLSTLQSIFDIFIMSRSKSLNICSKSKINFSQCYLKNCSILFYSICISSQAKLCCISKQLLNDSCWWNKRMRRSEKKK